MSPNAILFQTNAPIAGGTGGGVGVFLVTSLFRWLLRCGKIVHYGGVHFLLCGPLRIV